MLVGLIALINVDFITELVDTAIPAKVNEEATGHVLDCPKVKSCQDDHNDEGQDLLADDCVQEEEREYRGSLKEDVEEARNWVIRRRKECLDEAFLSSLLVLIGRNRHSLRRLDIPVK